MKPLKGEISKLLQSLYVNILQNLLAEVAVVTWKHNPYEPFLLIFPSDFFIFFVQSI